MSFIIIGRGDDQDAEDLLEVIKGRLEASSYAIFDATTGNANVSLEYGYAEAKNIPRVLYMSTHRAAHKGKDASIISDLAGKMRKHYSNEAKLFALLLQFSAGHAYTKRFEKTLAKDFRREEKGTKKRLRSLALTVIHGLDGQSDVRRDDVVQNLRADQANYTVSEIDEVIRKLHKNIGGLASSAWGASEPRDGGFWLALSDDPKSAYIVGFLDGAEEVHERDDAIDLLAMEPQLKNGRGRL